VNRATLAVLIAATTVSALSADTSVSRQNPSRNTQSNTDVLKRWVFADVPLAEIVAAVPPRAPQENDTSPWRHFRQASIAAGRGDTAAARAELRAITTSPETRVQLLAWNALRKLGVQPELASAQVIRGVVIELHNEAGIGVLAAYEDGRARWLGGKGAAYIWDAPGEEPQITSLVSQLLSAAAPALAAAPAQPTHDSALVERDHVRLTVLTFGGTYIVNAYGPALDGRHVVTAPLLVSMQLLDLLRKKVEAVK
jgi:hypothetical protein